MTSENSGSGTKRHVLVINQHGDNRGDEAAMKAMLEGLETRLGPTSFTIMHQFNTPESSCVDTGRDVEYLPIRVPLALALRLGVWAVLAKVGLRFDKIAGSAGAHMISKYDEADIVISAPGGPYFGDLYSNHEIVHWFYVWIARLLKKPLALYAPSCGPFEHRLLNPVRRLGYSWFDVVTLRESVSAGYLKKLTSGKIDPTVTADSAFQSHVAPSEAVIDRSGDVDFQVVVAVRQPDPEQQQNHDASIVAAIVAIAAKRNARFYLLPQLHGNKTQDRPYLEGLAESVPAGIDTRVLPQDLDSDAQRGLVGASDMVIAGRYHPGVFAVSAHVPAFIVPYEHKARGMAEAAEVDAWAVDLGDLTPENATTTVDDLLGRLDEVHETLVRTEPAMMARSALTSEVVAQLVNTSSGH